MNDYLEIYIKIGLEVLYDPVYNFLQRFALYTFLYKNTVFYKLLNSIAQTKNHTLTKFAPSM